MRLLDVLKNTAQHIRETAELYRLHSRLQALATTAAEKREALIQRVLKETFAGTFAGSADDRLTGIVRNLVIELLTYEGLFIAPAAMPVAELSTAQTWEAQKLLARQLSALEDPHAQEAIANTLMDCVMPIVPDHLPPEGQEHEHSLSCPLISFLPDHAYAIEMAIAAILTKSAKTTRFRGFTSSLTERPNRLRD